MTKGARSRKAETPKANKESEAVQKKNESKQSIILRVIGWGLGFVQFLIGVVIVVMFGLYMFYGGGTRFPPNDLVTLPLYDSSSLEKMIDLPFPPGNIAVSSSDRVFFTLHPEGRPPFQVCELQKKPGEKAGAVPFPSSEFQKELDSVLSVRIAPDAQGNELLWILDYGIHAWRLPKLIAIDINTREEVHRYEFSREVAPFLSMLNDFQIDPEKQIIYIADAGIFRKRGAIIVYDIASQSARRVLDGHPSVTARNYKTIVNSTDFYREMVVLGVFTVKPNVDSIALSRDGKWLYYASVNDQVLYRVFTTDLLDKQLTPEVLGSRVQEFVNKTQSDGMTTDSDGNLYYGDMEHSAIMRINTRFNNPVTETLLQDDKRLRWPDGFSFGPNGFLYVTCSALQHVIFKTDSQIQETAPYNIFRFRPGFTAPAGQ